MLSTERLNQWLINQLNLLIQYLPPPWALAVASFVLVASLCVCERFITFNRPDWLHKNKAVQLLGKFFSLLSLAANAAVLLVIGLAVCAAVKAGVLLNLWQLVSGHVWWLGLGALIGMGAGLAARWFLIPNWEREEGLSFVDRDIARQGTKKGFDPCPFFDGGNKAVFIGKDEHDLPVSLTWAQFNSTHIPVVGATGSGKGVALQTLTSQAHRAGQTILIFDPKPCEILPRVLAQEARRSQRAMHFIDLRVRAAQINPLVGLTEPQLIGLLIEILELKKTGEPKSDHYRELAQKGIRRLAELVNAQQEPITFQGLLALAEANPEIAESENLLSGLEKFSRFSQFHTTDGLDLGSAIESGDIVYFAGDGSDEDLATVQRTLLSRTMQILSSRADKTRPVCLVIDELADLLTGTVLGLLGKVRSMNVHALLAFQTPGNLRLARGVDEEAAFSVCWGNTTIKIIYRLEEFQFAEEIAKRIGPQPTQIKTLMRDNATGTTRVSWTQGNRLKVEAHEITNLPMPIPGSGQAAMGFLVGAGESKRIHLGPVPILRSGTMPTAFRASPAAQVSRAEEKI